MSKLTVVDHPVIARDLTILRDKNSSIAKFRRAMQRMSIIMAYHALDELPLNSVTVETPIEETTGHIIAKNIVVVPILRAGLTLTDAILQFIPRASVGHVGMYRDEESHQPVDYYSNIPPNISEAIALVVDPMLATGGSAHDALTFLENEGAQHIRFISLISAPDGVSHIQNKHPEVPIFTSAIDDKLNEDAFIVPGLGDAGDRYFGTE